MFPIEWIKIERAHELKHGDFAYLPDLDMAPVLVGTINGFTIPIRLGADVSKCTTIAEDDLTGAALVVRGFRFEGSIKSLEKLDNMDDRYESLVVTGKSIGIVVRPPSGAGYAVIGVGELEQGNSSSVQFAYRDWRIVKDRGLESAELYRRKAVS